MLTFVQGEDLTITVPLTRDGEPFVADAGSVRWSLRDHTGQTVLTNQTLPDTEDTALRIPVAASNNNISGVRQFEKRSITVRGTVDDEAFVLGVQYRLTAWLNHSVSCDAVRAFIGTDAGELPDSEIDLVAAYFEIQDVIGETALTEALDSGLRLEQIANDAIKARAVLAVLPGMQARMSKREEDGTMKVERFAIDFDKLAAEAQRLIRLAAREVGLIDDAATVPTLFVLAGRTVDEVTGDAPA